MIPTEAINLTERIELLTKLGTYLLEDGPEWEAARQQAFLDNNWFITDFVNIATAAIATQFLQPAQLKELALKYEVPSLQPHPKRVGIVMAGNIPLVGFHDFLCVFISGHKAIIKPSSKDEALITHLIKKLTEWNAAVGHEVMLQPMLKGCDAYIATGSNNSGRYFEHYFARFPHIIRKNRSSVAWLSGTETAAELERLADDIHLYFGLGCRNVTKLYVPEGYDWVPLLEALRKYSFIANHHKYKNNYDYQLAAHIINSRYYMTNGAVLLVEDKAIFAPIAQVHYEYYKEGTAPEVVKNSDDIQCITGASFLPFGAAQTPGICDFADGVDTMDFLVRL